MMQVTLDTCAQEPIHIPGAIQPHGVLFACQEHEDGGERPGPGGADAPPPDPARALVVLQVSANVARHLGVEPDAVLGRPLPALLSPESAERLLVAVRHPQLREINPLRVTVGAGPRAGAPLDAVLHRPPHAPGVLVVEMEPPPASLPESGPTFDPRLRGSVVRLQSAHDVARLCQVAADEVRALTGFDRVMVYRFDPSWNGEVVAESRRDDLEPFLGQHYPASDIPEQARRLYTVNWLRFICDVDYRPAPLVPVLNPRTAAPLDLSHSVLRSVSPIHIEYLHNMGVTASMSVSLILEGKLIGLIACHHYSGPRIIPFMVRDTVEYLGQALSWHLGVLEMNDASARALRLKRAEAELVRSILSSRELLDGLAAPALLELTAAAGAAVVLQDGVRRLGTTPHGAVIAELVEWLQRAGHDVFATDCLAEHLPSAATVDEVAAGVLAVAISRELGEYLLWFRPPQERVVDWAGDPRKVVVATEEAGRPPRLSPRGSFALWREVVKGRSVDWDRLHVEAASSLRRVLVGGLRRRAAELEVMNQRLLESDRVKDAFIATVSHELRTPLNSITGWIYLLQNSMLPADKWPQAFEVISRNARAQTQIVDDLLDVSRIASGKLTLDVENVDLVSLVEGVLEGTTLSIEAKGLRLKRVYDPSAATVLGDVTRLRQVVSNLVTNAIKFTPKGGTITVTLRRLSSDVELAVSDTGQGISAEFMPRLFEMFRQEDAAMNRRSQGLGLGLSIVRKLVELHGGRVVAESEGVGRGATFRVTLPMAPVQPAAAKPETEAGGSRVLECPPELRDLAVLLIEDEADARAMVRHVLAECGADVTDVGDASSALDLLAVRQFDLVISDIGLPGIDGLQFMRLLREREARGRRTPAIALTAYTRGVDRTRALQVGFQAHVPKPVDPQELVVVAASVAGRLP